MLVSSRSWPGWLAQSAMHQNVNTDYHFGLPDRISSPVVKSACVCACVVRWNPQLFLTFLGGLCLPADVAFGRLHTIIDAARLQTQVCGRSITQASSTRVLAMAPKKEMAFQKSERKRLEAQRELTRGQVQEINKNMKQHPQLVPSLYEALQRTMRENGLQQPDSSSVVHHTVSLVRMLALPAPPTELQGEHCVGSASMASGSSSGDFGGSAASSEAGSSNQAASSPGHARSYRSLESSSVVFLQELLSAIEPVVFAKHCLAVVTRRGARLQNIKALCEIIDLCTGMAGTEQIVVGDDKGVTAVLKLRLCELNLSFGRRGLETPLPPDWAAHGVYNIILDGANLKVQNRFTSTIKVIKAPELKRVDKKLVYVHDNYSERRATLKAKGSIMNILLFPIFEPSAFHIGGSAADATPPPKKRRTGGLLALADGSAQASGSRAGAGVSSPPFASALAAQRVSELSAATTARHCDNGGHDDDDDADADGHVQDQVGDAKDATAEGSSDEESPHEEASGDGGAGGQAAGSAGKHRKKTSGAREADMIPPPPAGTS